MDVRVLALELRELFEERRRLAVAVRVDEGDAIREPVLDDVAEHAAEHRDADPAGNEDVRHTRILRKQEAPFRLLDVDVGADGELRERPFEGRVPEAGAETQDAALVRRGDDRDVAAWALLVVVRRVEQRDPEVLTRSEVDVAAEQVEHDHQGALRDLALFLDLCVHGAGA